MRKEKFNNKLKSYNNDDIAYAFGENSLGGRLDDIDVIVAEVVGENDELSWYWILQMKDGSFSWAEGSCDYTGWDCQSGAQITDGFETPEEAIKDLEISNDPRKSIREVLLKQIKEEIPFALYQEEESEDDNTTVKINK